MFQTGSPLLTGMFKHSITIILIKGLLLLITAGQLQVTGRQQRLQEAIALHHASKAQEVTVVEAVQEVMQLQATAAVAEEEEDKV